MCFLRQGWSAATAAGVGWQFAAAALFLVSPAQAQAATVVWDGASDFIGSFNWIVDGTPDQGFPGAPGNTIQINSGTVFRTADFGTSSTSQAFWQLGGSGAFQLSQTNSTGYAGWNIYYDDVTVADDFRLDLLFIHMRNSTAGSTPSRVTVTGGEIIVRDPNSFRSNPGFADMYFSIDADPFTATITQTVNSNTATTLTSKVNGGYFRIDGQQVFGTGSANQVNGKWLEITTSGGEQTLAVVPEPGGLMAVTIGGLVAAGWLRRRFAGGPR